MTTTLEPIWNPELERRLIRIEIVETGWGPWWEWAEFSHYLVGSGPMPFSTAFTGFDSDTGVPVSFIGVSGMWAGQRRVARACRLVVHPEWQGAGIGMRFLNAVCQREWEGRGFIGSPVPTYFHTAHSALISALRRDPHWTQVSAKLIGGAGSRIKKDLKMEYGGHFRSVSGWRYKGD